MAEGMVMKKSQTYSSKACFVNHFLSTTFQAGKHINNLKTVTCVFPKAFPPLAWNSYCDWEKKFLCL